jgi:hypothetical protein
MSPAMTSTPSAVGACSRRAFRRRWLTSLLGRALSFPPLSPPATGVTQWRDEVGFDCMEREYVELAKMDRIAVDVKQRSIVAFSFGEVAER